MVNKLLVIIIAIIAVVGVGFLGYAFEVMPQNFVFVSVDRVDFISNDPEIDGDAWLVEAVLDGSGQYLIGNTIDKERISDSATKEKAKYDLKITGKLDRLDCEYDIRETEEGIIKADHWEKGNVWFLGWGSLKEQCISGRYVGEVRDNGALFFIKESFGGLRGTVSCITFDAVARRGRIGTPRTIFDAEITVSNGKGVGKARVNNVNTSSSNLYVGSEKIGNVKWAGNLVTGSQCPVASDQELQAMHSTAFGGWVITDGEKYDRAWSTAPLLLDNCMKSWTQGSGSPSSCVSTFNGFANDALAEKEFTYYNANSNIKESTTRGTGSVTTGKILLSPPEILQRPSFIFRIKANWLGVFVPVGIPKIVSVSSLEANDTTTGFIQVDVENVGSEKATFEISASCTEGFSPARSQFIYNLEPDDVGSVFLPVQVFCERSKSGTCTITAKDINNPDKKDEMSTSSICSPIISCTANKESCFDDVIKRCNSEGSGYDIEVEDCGTQGLRCIEIEGEVSCVNTEPVCGDGACEQGENVITCFEDCFVAEEGKCGDGICNIGETSETCEKDCGPGVECNFWDVGCHLSVLWGKFTNILIYIGLATVVIFLIWIIIKLRGGKKR